MPQIVVKGPKALALLAGIAIYAWYNIYDYTRADFVAGYSGTVVETGTDYHWLGPKPHMHYYIVVRDSTGKRTKRYVRYYGHAAVQVGEYVVKQPGYGEAPIAAVEHP